MKWPALTKLITRLGLFIGILSCSEMSYMSWSLRDAANDCRRDANPPGGPEQSSLARGRAFGRARLPQGHADRSPSAPRGAADLCCQGHHAGDDARGTLAGAAGPRGVGAGWAPARHRSARRHRDAHAVFRPRLAEARAAP